MRPMFGRGPSLEIRLVMAAMVAIALFVADRTLPQTEQLKFYLRTVVSPIQLLANSPRDLLDWTSENVKIRGQLIAENERLRKQHLIDSEQLQLVAQLRAENNRLRSLLGSPEKHISRKMVAEVVAVRNDRHRLQVMIDKGRFEGVYEGQPILDAEGVVGQVTSVGPATSRVLLIADAMHAIPVRVLRNDVRAIVVGTGRTDQLMLQHVPHSTDIEVGDLLISSGLGGRFPEGFPVAKVTSVELDESRPFAAVTAQPVAQLDRLRYLLLLWPQLAERTEWEAQ